MRNVFKLLFVLLITAASTACSLDKMLVRLSMPVVESRMQALLEEDDYEIAMSALPGHIQSLETMLVNDPGNSKLHVYAAYAYYSFAFAFVEDEHRNRASRLYYRCMEHGKKALREYGIDDRRINGPTGKLKPVIDNIDHESIRALFWTGMCWGKIVEMDRGRLLNMLQWHKAIMMMRRVYELDAAIYLQGPRLFFGAYYGSRSLLLGGDPDRSEKYFQEARQATGGELLIVDVLEAQYLARRRGDRQSFHDILIRVLNAPDSSIRDYALINAVARHKAAGLLKKEQEWFKNR